MEAIPTATQDDSIGTNPSSVKSDDSSPRHESGRGSPPPKCAICLGTCRNKSFTDSCLHQFCFKCLLTWSKVKAECPLCKQNFRSIIHNVRSNHQYEEYMVEQRQTEETVERIDIDNLTSAATRRFRYRTTLTLPRRESMAIQQLLVHSTSAGPHSLTDMVAHVIPLPLAYRAPPARRRRSPAAFRRTVYRHNLWARPLPDFTGRFRDCTPEFYRYNDSQMHRLVPWLNRELYYLLNENVGHISYVMTRILELLPQYHITSPEFSETMSRYFGERTEHFLHELYCFASTPYDMTGYDRNVQYTTDTRISTMINEVISSSDSDSSVDSDIVMISHSEPAEPPPGPSRPPDPVYPHNYIPNPQPGVIPIETILGSDTDDDSSEVMVVGYIKPPQDRTPEVVDLLGSDSDVIVQDAEPAQGPSGETRNLVKLSLKRHKSDSDSEESYRPPPRRRRRGDSTTSDTSRDTPDPRTPEPPPSPPSPDAAPSPPSPDAAPSPPSPDTPSMPESPTSPSMSSSPSTPASACERRKPKKRVKRKQKETRTRRKTKKRSRSRSRQRDRRHSADERDRRRKHKSRSGKGVKSSRRASPGPSEPGPSGDGPARSRDTRRLKSVVNVMYGSKSSPDSTPSGSSSYSMYSQNPSGSVDDDRTSRMSSERETGEPRNDDSDPEDDLPLNLTVQKGH